MWSKLNILSSRQRRTLAFALILVSALNACGRDHPAPHTESLSAAATAINTITGKTFNPLKDGLPYNNFSDLMFTGYCLGITAIHAFSTLPPAQRLESFGPTVEAWFNENPATNDNSAWRLMRLFSLLQMTKSWTLFSNNSGAHKIQTLEEIKKIHDLLEIEPHRSRGIIGLLQKIRSIPSGKDSGPYYITSGMYHMVYIFGSRFQNGIYTFSYLDPNHPRQTLSLSYDSVTFSEDKKLEMEFKQSPKDPISLIMYSTVDQMLVTAKASLAEIQKNTAYSARLKFIGMDDSYDFMSKRNWDSHDEMAKQWLQNLNYDQINLISPLGRRAYISLKDYREYEKFAAIAQAQLDLDCGGFQKFYSFVKQQDPSMFIVLDTELRRVIQDSQLTLDVDVTSYKVPQATQKTWRCLQKKFTYLFDIPKEE